MGDKRHHSKQSKPLLHGVTAVHGLSTALAVVFGSGRDCSVACYFAINAPIDKERPMMNMCRALSFFHTSSSSTAWSVEGNVGKRQMLQLSIERACTCICL